MSIVSKNQMPGEKPLSDKEMIAAAERALADIAKVREGVGRVIFGQEAVVERTLVAILAGGHALLVGVPGSPRPNWWKRWAWFSASTHGASSSRRI